jgi:hypothetical protein
MRTVVPIKLENGRIRTGHLSSDASYGMIGAFRVVGPSTRSLGIVSSGPDSESGWEHVSVSLYNRTPNWQEMCFVKDLFWEEDEWVVQYHPSKKAYVNCHPYCLHLWKPINALLPIPPSGLVGPKI